MDEKLDESDGGILLPDSAKEVPVSGTIVAVGPGLRRPVPPNWENIPMNTKVGDHIHFSRFVAQSSVIKINQQEYIVLKEEDILAIDVAEEE